MWLLMLYAPIRLFNLGLHNYKIEKQNKQFKTFQVVLLTRLSVGGAGVVCVGGGGGRGVPIPLITYPCVVWWYVL